jgi:polyisoprenoid-binding protein YceI
VTGTFSRWSADIRYDPADPGAARLRLHVDTASAATGDTRRDEAMTGADWLDSKRAPVAIFESSGFRPLGGDAFETAGTLRLRDGARPLTLSFKLNLAGDEARAQGSANLDRTQFGVGQGRWSGPAIVGFNVRVTFDLQARRAR